MCTIVEQKIYLFLVHRIIFCEIYDHSLLLLYLLLPLLSRGQFLVKHLVVLGRCHLVTFFGGASS